ncbi:MAG: polysaccharide biosynthesis C-terminal domain-containing protein [Bacteroidetes bacterium]|nr:polysaccharide biosynthesis C-terminal domain-containing protein [Bacteroidota bacterium]
MGSIKKQGLANTVISYVGTFIGFLNLVILQPFMLSPQELGLTRILYSFTILVGTVFPIGLNFLTIKFFPTFKNKENGHNGYLGLLLIVAFVGYFIAFFSILLLKSAIVSKYHDSPLFVEYFNYVFPISFCVGFVSIISGYCNALFKSSIPSFLNEIYLRLFATIIVVLYFLKIISFDVFVFLYSFSYALQLIFLLLYVFYLRQFHLKINFSFFQKQNKKEIITYTAFLAVGSLASIGIRNIDIMLVGSYLDLHYVAIYTLGMTIGSLIEIPINSLGRIADAKISDAIQRNDWDMVCSVYKKSIEKLTLFGGFLLIMLYVNINDAITFINAQYATSKNVILIISFSAFVNMATGLNTSIIYYSHKYILGTLLLLGTILVSIFLNVILIPLYGIEGAAWATSIAMILYNVAKFFLIKKYFKMQPYNASFLKIIGSIFSCLLFSLFFPKIDNKYISMILNSVFTSITYLSLLLVFKIITTQQIKKESENLKKYMGIGTKSS